MKIRTMRSTPLVCLAVLGGCEAQLPSGRPVALPTRKAQALLAYLALVPGQAHPRERLVALLWGDADDQHARQSLRQALAAIRQAAPVLAQEGLVVEADTIEIVDGAVEVDARLFEALAQASTPDALERAAALYRGDVLEGLAVREPGFDEWLAGERRRLREVVVGVFARLTAQQMEARRLPQALETAQRLLRMDPLQEATHRTLMRLYLLLGHRGAALRQYRACADILRQEFRSRPDAETERVHREILDAGQAPGPPRILVVEDEATTRTLLEGFLAPAGYEVTLSADGADALLQLSRTSFDLVIADIRMPLLDGLKLLEIMRAKDLGTPVIVVTGRREGEAQALRMGAVDYVVKPIRRDVLLERVRKALRTP